ncbi:hypothetical protein [uncultured Thomasclavelia sp.]|uniref:hypothetical protein n=1 Tax=uncultured Thomasclavelia sp. TaxID=3025759 RepID=UPI002639CD6C|nr:hypothetical protein [uncultured Thomasclavelia sp.]
MKKTIVEFKSNLTRIFVIFEEIINIDKRGYTYFNSSKSYKNSRRSFDNNSYMHYLK